MILKLVYAFRYDRLTRVIVIVFIPILREKTLSVREHRRMVSVEIAIVLICTLFTSIVLTVNVVLLILMLRHTPKSFANFGIVMKFHVVSDIQTIIAAAAVMNR